AAVVRHDVFEAQFGFAAEVVAKRFVPLRVIAPGRLRRLQVAQVQPLPAEILDQRERPGVLQHPPGLRFADRGVGQLALLREVEQFVVGHRTPQEVRQPRCDLVVAERVAAVGAVGRSVYSAVASLRLSSATASLCLPAVTFAFTSSETGLFGWKFAGCDRTFLSSTRNVNCTRSVLSSLCLAVSRTR